MTILLFGQLTDLAQKEVITASSLADTDALKSWLAIEYPALANARYMVAVNKTIVQGNAPLNDNSEVALMPPFSGG